MAIEFVEDRVTRKPFDPSLKVHNRVQKNAMDNGLMMYGMGGTIDGRFGDHVLIAPPYVIDESHESELVDKLSTAVTKLWP